MTEDIHIASLVADVSMTTVDEISKVIEAVPFAEIAVKGNDGKLVILIDAPSMSDLVKTTDDIRDLKGIISLLPVYQHNETDPAKEDQEQKMIFGLEKRI